MSNFGKQILSNCVDRYTSLGSYQDSGLVRTWLSSDHPPCETKFCTYYMKPDNFRFEWSSPHPYPPLHHIVTEHACGYDGGTAFSMKRRPEKDSVIQLEESLELAVAGATGISFGSIQTIAQLLFPQISGLSLCELTDINSEGEEDIEGETCYKITGVHQKLGPRSIWVGKSDYFLRMLSDKINGSPSEEVRSNIIINADIQLDMFRVPQ